MSIKVELGFTQAGVGAPFIVIGDPVKGVIGSQDYYIGGGEVFVDVSAWFQALTINRGKVRELERFDAGRATVQFNNRNRFFDPTYEASPYYGQIVPKRAIKISVDNVVVFTGTVDDWNIDYEPSGNSTATLVASDAFSIIGNNTLTTFSAAEQKTGARITAVLDNIDWPANLRDIDTGEETIVSQASITGDNALEYMTKVELSEIGYLFVNKAGEVRFISRNGAFGDSVITFADDGTGVPYQNIQATYGSEFLYNRITNISPVGTAVAEDTLSQATYGIFDYELNSFNTSSRLSPVAQALLNTYKEPEYRFQNLTVTLDTQTPANKAALIDAELGDIVQIKFTPSGIPPEIVNLSRIIGIQHSASPNESLMTFQLASIEGSPLVIGSPTFGIIGLATVGF